MTIVLLAPRVLLSRDAVRGVRAGTNRAGVGMARVPRRRRGRRRARAGVLLPNVRSRRVRRIPERAAFLRAPRSSFRPGGGAVTKETAPRQRRDEALRTTVRALVPSWTFRIIRPGGAPASGGCCGDAPLHEPAQANRGRIAERLATCSAADCQARHAERAARRVSLQTFAATRAAL